MEIKKQFKEVVMDIGRGEFGKSPWFNDLLKVHSDEESRFLLGRVLIMAARIR